MKTQKLNLQAANAKDLVEKWIHSSINELKLQQLSAWECDHNTHNQDGQAAIAELEETRTLLKAAIEEAKSNNATVELSFSVQINKQALKKVI